MQPQVLLRRFTFLRLVLSLFCQVSYDNSNASLSAAANYSAVTELGASGRNMTVTPATSGVHQQPWIASRRCFRHNCRMKSQTCRCSAKQLLMAFFDELKGLVFHHRHPRVSHRDTCSVNQIFLILFIWLAGLGTATVQAAELSGLPKFQGSTVKPKWISKRLSLEELESMIHTERIQQIIALSQIQSDASNPWIIDGVKGSGPMPRAYYKEAISELLKDAPELIRLRREILPGDQLFAFDSLQTSERIGKGFIAVRAGKVVFEWWTHDY